MIITADYFDKVGILSFNRMTAIIKIWVNEKMKIIVNASRNVCNMVIRFDKTSYTCLVILFWNHWTWKKHIDYLSHHPTLKKHLDRPPNIRSFQNDVTYLSDETKTSKRIFWEKITTKILLINHKNVSILRLCENVKNKHLQQNSILTRSASQDNLQETLI